MPPHLARVARRRPAVARSSPARAIAPAGRGLRPSVAATLLAAALVIAGPFAAVGAATTGAATAGVRPPLADVVRAVDRSLVHVEAGAGYGSGFFLRDRRTVVTAAHVLGDLRPGDELVLRPVAATPDGLADLGPPFTAELRAVHPRLDLAVLLVPAAPPGARPLASGPPAPMLARGREVLVHGFPSPMAPTLSRGVVSAHQRDFADGATYDLLDAPIGGGSSGGPVTDREGRLVGMATAVHTDGDPTSFNWTDALPRAVIEAMVPPGGAAAIDPPVPARELVERIRTAPDDASRLARLAEAFDELLATRARPAPLASDLETLVRAVAGLVRPRTAPEVRRLLELVIAFEARLARRAVHWSLAGVVPDPAMQSRLDELDRLSTSWTREVAEAGLAAAGPEDRGAWERATLEPLARALEEAAAAAADACDLAMEVHHADELTLRGLDRAEVVEALGDLAHLGALLERLEASPPPDPGGAAVLPAERWAVFRRFAEAARAASEAWEALTPACRGLEGEIDSSSPEAIRESLAAAGWRTAAPPRGPIALAPWASETFVLELDGLGATAFRLMGISSDGQDVDLLLEAPDGTPHDEDMALDGDPIVGGDAAAGSGPWRVTASSAADRPTTMVLELWVR